MGIITANGEDISNDEYILTNKQFHDMRNRRIQYKQKNNKEPSFIRLPSPDQKGYVLLSRMQELEKRFYRYEYDHQTQPNLICITTGGCGFGKAKSMTLKEKYDSMIGIGYNYYYDDKYTPEQEKERINKRLGLNCSDYSQYMMKWCKDNGYNAEYIHRYCKSGSGHILLRVWGKEYGDSEKNGIYVDMAAGASIGSKYPLGRSWCKNYQREFVSTEPWLTINDGR